MPLRHSVRLLAIRATGAPLGRAREVLETIGIRLPACFTTRAALALPAGDEADRSDLSRRACKDAAMPIAKSLLQCALTFGDELFVGRLARERDGMTKEPSRTPPQLSFVVRAGAGGRTADLGAQRL